MKQARTIYVYSNTMELIQTFTSINDCASQLQIPKTTVQKAIDKKLVDESTKTMKAKRVHCEKLNQLVIFRSTKVPNK